MILTSQLGRALEKALTNIDLNQYVPHTDKVPLAPHAFYKTFGYQPSENAPASDLSVAIRFGPGRPLDYKRVIAVDPQIRTFDVAARDILSRGRNRD